MFLDFLFHLRTYDIKVSTTEWLVLMRALSTGLGAPNLEHFYTLSRALLIKKESLFDRYDRAFLSFFKDIEDHFDLSEELLDWLNNPILPNLSPEELAKLQALDLDELREKFLERLKAQTERHDGGSHWIGTGGTSPFGHGGQHPSGIRVGGAGGGRSAVQVAEARRFRNLSQDQVIDTRQMGVALRRLRKLAKEKGPEELHLQKTIDKSARDGGEIDLVFAPPRKNNMKMLLLMDVGGSMDPYVRLSERLFSAAHAANHFKKFKAFTFHNCVYEKLYVDIANYVGVLTDDVLKEVDETWTCLFVGDAWMSPYELVYPGGAIDYGHHNRIPGIEWLKKIKERIPKSVWLNPEPERVWQSESIAMIRRIFPMYHFSVDGLIEAVDDLRGAKSASL